MTTLSYLHLAPGEIPSEDDLGPHRAVVVIESPVTDAWRGAISAWLVRSGCLYMMAWGLDCSKWDDSVDSANLEEFDYGEIPDEKFVMTTWHERGPLAEVFWFAQHCADHPTVELTRTLLVDVSSSDRQDEILEAYRLARDGDQLDA